jgi:hypothetical protein
MTLAEDPFTGNWILNREKSNFDANHQPLAAVSRWERTADGYHMRAEGQKEGGQTIVDQAIFLLDGREHPIPDAPGFTAYSEQLDPRTLHAVGRKDGQVVGEGTYTISEDGRTLTATVRGIDVQHRPFQTVVVWDRQMNGAAPIAKDG